MSWNIQNRNNLMNKQILIARMHGEWLWFATLNFTNGEKKKHWSRWLIKNKGNFIKNTGLDDISLKIIPYLTLTFTKEVKALVKKEKVALSVLLHKSHKRKYISWLMHLNTSDVFKLFKTSPGRERGGG